MAAGSGMHHHAGGLIDSDHIRVLVEDFEWQVFRLCVERWQLGRLNVDRFGAMQQIRPLLWRVVDPHSSGRDPLLEASAAVLRQSLMQIEVEPLAGITTRCFQMDHEDTTSYIQEV